MTRRPKPRTAEASTVVSTEDLTSRIRGGCELDDAGLEAFARDAKIGLLATVGAGGLPHLTLITSIRTSALLRREEEVPDSATRVLRPRSWLELREVRPVRVRRSLVTRVREVGGEVVHHRLARTVRSSRSSRTSGRLGALRFGLEETTPGGGCLHRSLGSFTGEARFNLPCLDDVERLRRDARVGAWRLR